MPNDGVILELQRKPCETLLSTGSHTALKFLAALNQDLISALRGADHRLLQLSATGWLNSEATTTRYSRQMRRRSAEPLSRTPVV
jgi:hypothetical protein